MEIKKFRYGLMKTYHTRIIEDIFEFEEYRFRVKKQTEPTQNYTTVNGKKLIRTLRLFWEYIINNNSVEAFISAQRERENIVSIKNISEGNIWSGDTQATGRWSTIEDASEKKFSPEKNKIKELGNQTFTDAFEEVFREIRKGEGVTKTIQIKNILKDAVEWRYSAEKPQRGEPKDQGLIQILMGEDAEYTSGVCISEYAAMILGLPQINIMHLYKKLGYTNTDITRILREAKKKQTKLILVGFGGTGSNFYHWLSQLCDIAGVREVFDEITVYDRDQWEIHNIPRVPFNLNGRNYSIDKAKCYIDYAKTAKIVRYSTDWFNPASEPIKDTILYGGPDLGVRKELFESEHKFIASIHDAESQYLLWKQNTEEFDMIQEGYGQLRLATFFMNQLKTVITFLEMIGNEDLINNWDEMEDGYIEIKGGRIIEEGEEEEEEEREEEEGEEVKEEEEEKKEGIEKEEEIKEEGGEDE